MGTPAGHYGACDTFGATLLLERPILTAPSFLFTLVSLATVRATAAAKASHDPCEEIQVFRGVQDTRALVGKVFMYPISPFAFQGKVTHYKVTLSNGSALPKWLEFNPNTRTLQGLPMPEERGEYRLTVTAYGEACGPQIPTTGVNFALHVQDHVFVHQKETKQGQNNVQNTICSSGLCARNISVTFAGLIIHYTTSSLEIQERLYLVSTMAEYLHLDPSLLTLMPFEGSFRRYLCNLTMLAEDIRYVNSLESHYVGLYWPVGFGVFAMFYELLQVLQHTMESNHLSQLLGYEIAGWRVVKQEGHEKMHSGQRRRRQLMATPRLTPRPTKTEGFMMSSITPVHTTSVPRPWSEVTITPVLIYTHGLHPVTSEGDLEASDMLTLLNVHSKTTSSVLQDLLSTFPEFLPSLILTSLDDFLPSVTSEDTSDMQTLLDIQTETSSVLQALPSTFPEFLPSLIFTSLDDFLHSVTSKGDLETSDMQTSLNVHTKIPTSSVLQDLLSTFPKLFPSLIFTSLDDFLHSVTSKGDLETSDMQTSLKFHTKTPKSSVLQDLPSTFPELFPSLISIFSDDLLHSVTSKGDLETSDMQTLLNFQTETPTPSALHDLPSTSPEPFPSLILTSSDDFLHFATSEGDLGTLDMQTSLNVHTKTPTSSVLQDLPSTFPEFFPSLNFTSLDDFLRSVTSEAVLETSDTQTSLNVRTKIPTSSVLQALPSTFPELFPSLISTFSDDLLHSVTSKGDLETSDMQTLLNFQTETPTPSALHDLPSTSPEPFPSLILTSSDDFLHFATSEGDLRTLDMQTQTSSSRLQDLSSAFPFLMTTTELEDTVTSKTPSVSQQSQSQVPQPTVYLSPMSSESKHHFVLYHFGFSVPTSKTQFSKPMEGYISTAVTPFKRTPLVYFGEETSLEYTDPYTELEASGFIFQDITSISKAPISLFESSSQNQDVSSSYKHASEEYISVRWMDNSLFTEEHYSPFATIQTKLAIWKTDFSFTGITSTSGSPNKASAHKLEASPDPSPTVGRDNIPDLAIYSTQELNTPILAHSLEFGLLSRTSSTPARLVSIPISLSIDLTVGQAEELFSDRRQVSPEVSQIYEHSLESSMAVSETYGYLLTKDQISALSATHINTPLWNEPSHFICVTSTHVPVLSTRLISDNGLFQDGISGTSERPCYDAPVFSWPVEFGGSLKASLSTNDVGFDYNSVDRTSAVYPGPLHLDTSDLSLASSFGTKVNFQITRELTSELMKEPTSLSDKETPSQHGFHATSLDHGSQGDSNTSPRLVNAIKWLTATIGYKFFFSIPQDTFYDQEDGNTTQLILGMNPADYSPGGLESWLQFNSCYQSMHGYPLDHDFQYSPQEFLLFATDSGGLRASDTFTIELLRPTTTPCHVYTIKTKNSYHSFLRNRKRICLFFEKLSNYLNGPGNVTLLHLRPGSTVIAWYNNSICTSTDNRCATDEIQRVLIQLGVPGGNVNPDFAKAMLPEYKIDQIQDIIYGGICSDIANPFNASLPSNRTVNTFKDSRSWIRNIFFILFISVTTTVMVILIITFQYCKYHKKVSGSQSASIHARPFLSYVDFEMDVLKSRKPPILDQDVLQATQPWLLMPPPSQQHLRRPKRTLTVSRLPPPPKYRLPPSYGMEESDQSCRDHSYGRSKLDYTEKIFQEKRDNCSSILRN